MPAPADVTATPQSTRTDATTGTPATLRVAPYGELVTVQTWTPSSSPSGIVVVTSSSGLAGLQTSGGKAAPVVQRLLAAGQTVVALDAFGQRADAVTRNRLVENRAAAAYTYGYNSPLVVERAHDVLAALRHARSLAGPSRQVTLVALDGPSSAWAALARAGAGGLADAAAFATDGFRFASVSAFDDPSFLPGGAKYGDLPAALTLAAPKPLFIAGESGDAVTLLKDAYNAAGAPDALHVSTTSGDALVGEIADWIVRRRHK